MLANVAVMASTACTSSGDHPGDGGSATATPSGSGTRPGDDYGAEMERCMGGKGWDVSAGADGGLEAQYPTEQRDQYRADMEACHEELGYDMSLDYTAQEASELYDTYVQAADCVRDLGYPVPEPPSRGAFVETLTGGDIASVWHPYDGIAEQRDRAALREARDTCPVDP